MMEVTRSDKAVRVFYIKTTPQLADFPWQYSVELFGVDLPAVMTDGLDLYVVRVLFTTNEQGEARNEYKEGQFTKRDTYKVHEVIYPVLVGTRDVLLDPYDLKRRDADADAIAMAVRLQDEIAYEFSRIQKNYEIPLPDSTVYRLDRYRIERRIEQAFSVIIESSLALGKMVFDRAADGVALPDYTTDEEE